MSLLKKWARHKIKSFIYCVNQFLCQKPHKKWNQECKQKHMFNFCNIFDLLISRTQKIAWWPPVFKPDFHNFPIIPTFQSVLFYSELKKACGNFVWILKSVTSHCNISILSFPKQWVADCRCIFRTLPNI